MQSSVAIEFLCSALMIEPGPTDPEPTIDPAVGDPMMRQLLSPEAYGHPVAAGGPQLLETHLSWVLLSGPYAYKLKKPVAFGFVDFSTAELREQACRDELRLNRRLSPERYLDVVPVYGPLEAARFIPPATSPSSDTTPAVVIAWAVRMVQFDQEQLLPAALAAGQVGEGAIKELAERLARFHRDAATAGPETPWGQSEAVLQPVLDNLTALADCPGAQAHLGHLTAWVRQQAGALQPWFGQRQRGCHIRECHGDLHLGNMLLGASGIEVFDALEFSETLRWIDPISELAFLVMDLAVRGRADLGTLLLNSWVEASGDGEGLCGWAWYSVYRALVRAKVSWLRLKQSGLAAAESSRIQTELAGYLRLAMDWVQRQSQPLVLMHGLAGSGKSTVAVALGQQLGAVVFRSDVERKRLFGLWGVKPTRLLEGELYGQEASRHLYGTTLPALVEAASAGGLAVIVDACFLRRSERQLMVALAGKLGIPVQIVVCTAPEPLLRQRLLERATAGSDPSDATVEVLQSQHQWLEPLDPDEKGLVMAVPGAAN
ncbi:AAA family ATPase [Cyanobium sp. BA20m-14]|uniref:bifunctional aminoglycoside phosphotransferase/ATP-binding protein n=1 Tax=Cyanobium sp. BA20m-14 TaxID=2823703 RepID=UPI0020CCD2B9|nr:bifunctional aminoglycoside phosphotransferase/ATP-binding protein [Cyanobium sp. BA20m-14]MCP9912555.1 AAA family ATPase [Cyanobium sp. BA20m-14]